MRPTWLQAPLFATLPPPQQALLEQMAGPRLLEEGEMLFLEGEPCTGFYILERGAIQLTRQGEAGAHPTLAVLLPVQSFAEAAMFGDEAFPATATALKACRVVHFPKGPFLGALRADPDLAIAVIRSQAVWLRRIAQKVQDLTSADCVERLRVWLRAHLPEEGGYQLPTTKKTLAAQLGMSPETLSRALRNFQDQGLLEVRGTVLQRTGKL